jgi:hypothetical protein
MAWLQTWAPQMGTEQESVVAQKGTMKDIFARCLKKNVAQVCTVLKSCACRKEEFQLYTSLIASIAGKPTSKITVVMLLLYHTSKHPLLSFPMYKIRRIITGVYFSQVKNKP